MTTRIFQTGPLAVNSSITLDESASHHLARVLRAHVGEEIIVFNGLGGEYSGYITEMNKKTVTVDLKKFIQHETESPLDICLAQGISRGEKMDFTIQKAVELGAKEIVPLFTERCNVKLDIERSDKRLKHWRSVITSACEQSGRNRIPDIKMPQSLDKWLAELKADVCLVLSPYATQRLKQLIIPDKARIVLLIGPEGGLSEREINLAVQHGFIALNLGPRVLRTETAALAAISALQSCYGDMGG